MGKFRFKDMNYNLSLVWLVHVYRNHMKGKIMYAENDSIGFKCRKKKFRGTFALKYLLIATYILRIRKHWDWDVIFPEPQCTFDTVDTAKRAKQNLNGADIYSGCCTLKIDFAKVS